MMTIKEINEMKELNKKGREWFIDYWANYVRTHPDEDWSRQQNILINSVLFSSSEARKRKGNEK